MFADYILNGGDAPNLWQIRPLAQLGLSKDLEQVGLLANYNA